MKKLPILTAIISMSIIFSCSEDGDYLSAPDSSRESSGNGNQVEAGLITAGEWNDLSNWDFWDNLLNGQDYSQMPSYWGIYTNERISVQVSNESDPVVNTKVELLRNGAVVWKTKTDNMGYAELWIGLYQKEESVDVSELALKVNNEILNQELVLIEYGTNTVNINTINDGSNRVEISFIVDATGSMGDEMEFLKADLKNVIASVKSDDSNLEIYTSTVFYRDEGDEYVIRKSDFTNELSSTLDFINKQNAGGGGDFPEAVHTALNTAISELQWSDAAKTRIAFLLLDAPPHYTPEIKESLHNSLSKAAEKGIKIIPISASGIDKETEFLMRFFSIATNGTYVFITNDSGIGNEHLEASVGEYEIEYLNDLMIRLIKKYSE